MKRVKKEILAVLSLTLLVCSCQNMDNKTKETINKTGEVVGKSATEFIQGVTEGVDKTLKCDISLSQTLKDKGLEMGKYEIMNDSLGGRNSVLILYIIFNKDYNGSISAKVFDNEGAECGRTVVKAVGKAGNAGYFDFIFDKRTRIEKKSRITLE